jgi:glycosyltransferase involved in cell wall biosynthesis
VTAVLTVSELFWPEGGGAELATYLTLQILAKHGFSVTVVTGTKNPVKIPNVKYYTTPMLRSANRLTRWTLMEVLSTTTFFKQLLKNHDILYIPQAAYPLIPVAKKMNRRVIVHLHNYMPIRYTGVKYYFEPDVVDHAYEIKLALFHERRVQKSLLRTLLMPLSYLAYIKSKSWIAQADKIICVSHRQAELVTKNMPQLRNKVDVIYNPPPPEFANTDLPPKKRLGDEKVLLYLGGSSYIKGFHLILKAINKVSKKCKVKLVMAKVYDRKLPSHIYVVYSDLPHREVINLYSEAYALLFPSVVEEPLPYVLVESMLTGTIPIAARVGGVPEITKGTLAKHYTFTPGDVDDMVDKIDTLLAQPKEHIIDIGLKLKEHASKLFNIDQIKNKLLSAFGKS